MEDKVEKPEELQEKSEMKLEGNLGENLGESLDEKLEEKLEENPEEKLVRSVLSWSKEEMSMLIRKERSVKMCSTRFVISVIDVIMRTFRHWGRRPMPAIWPARHALNARGVPTLYRVGTSPCPVLHARRTGSGMTVLYTAPSA